MFKHLKQNFAARCLHCQFRNDSYSLRIRNNVTSAAVYVSCLENKRYIYQAGTCRQEVCHGKHKILFKYW